MRNYYRRRYQLFRRFDEGILMDLEGWYSVTPETISDHIAYTLFKKMNYNSNLTVLDAFCGCAGNTIQLAKYFDCVLAADIEFTKLACAQHNIHNVYNNENKNSIVHFIMQDFFSLHKTLRISSKDTDKTSSANGSVQERLESVSTVAESNELATNEIQENSDTTCDQGHDDMDQNNNDNKMRDQNSETSSSSSSFKIDLIFLSPPWGGVNYQQSREVDIGELPLDYFKIYSYCVNELNCKKICFFLPRNTSLDQIVYLAGPGGQIEIEQNFLDHKFVAITAYYGF